MVSNNQQAFLELVRVGLWEKEARLSKFGDIDYAEVLRLAEEQAVVGLVAAGLEHVVDVKIPQMWALQFAGQTIQLEQRNKAMNQFIADLVEKMRKADIYTLLVKGQGVAQCYNRPHWRTSGDIDFFLSDSNYEKAKSFLKPFASDGKPERQYSKEIGFYVNSWLIELHGTLHTGLSTKVDKAIDAVHRDVFFGGNVRSWNNGGTTVFLPAADEDVFIVFTHFIKHFYKEGGVSLRQMCDWCRLLYTYRDTLDTRILERRIKRSGLLCEWIAFAALAVDTLGMPKEAMPLYCEAEKWEKKSEKVLAFILKGGEWRKLQDTITVGKIFPMSAFKFAPGILLNVNWLKFVKYLLNASDNEDSIKINRKSNFLP